MPSYLTAWPSRDLIRAGHQQLTKEWWQTRRAGFDIYISQWGCPSDSTKARPQHILLRSSGVVCPTGCGWLSEGDTPISQFVLDEAAAGDAEAARERLAALQGLPILDLSEEVVDLARALNVSLALPEKAVTDAAHIATAAVHGMHFLLTWNCAHIANAEMFVAIEKACQEHGFSCPVICTPEELMGV